MADDDDEGPDEGEGAGVLHQSKPDEDDGDGQQADVEAGCEVGVTHHVDDVGDEADAQQSIADPVEDVPEQLSHVFVSEWLAIVGNTLPVFSPEITNA